MNRGTSDFNFNLLLVFDAVMQERSARQPHHRAGRELPAAAAKVQLTILLTNTTPPDVGANFLLTLTKTVIAATDA